MKLSTSEGSASGLGTRLQPFVVFVFLFLLAAVWTFRSISESGWTAFASNDARRSFSLSHLRGNGVLSQPSTILRALFKPIRLTQYSFVNNGTDYHISTDSPLWTEPLGAEVLILDMDTRSLHGENQILHNDTVPYENMEALSIGLLNHYMYALIHGYSYKLVRPQAPQDQFASWVKPSVLAEALNDHRIVVFMDSDALWSHPEVPVEWLLNHWNVTQDTSLAISLDPPKYLDSYGRNGVNTGFIVAQQSPRTQDILQSWARCPSGDEFPGCEEWANKRVFEQTAFNEYIRHAYNEPEDLLELPCDETDGFPEANINCTGVFVRHYWRTKDRLKEGAAAKMSPQLTEALHGQFLRHIEEVLVEDGADP